MFIKPAKKIITSFLFLAVSTFWISAQEPDRNVEQRLKDFLLISKHHTPISASADWTATNWITVKSAACLCQCELWLSTFHARKYRSHLQVTETKSSRPRQLLRYYHLCRWKADWRINPQYITKKQDKSRLWQRIDYKGAPWIQNMSRPYLASKGLEGRHIALWQSHGKYYKNNKGSWEWQRPRLFCTTEDLFTQSFVVPYIIPMLENAGAVVYTPRERDRQRNEVIVDNNTVTGKSIYIEEKSRKGKWKTSPLAGFARKRSVYTDGQNPFGTARHASPQRKKAWKGFCTMDSRYSRNREICRIRFLSDIAGKCKRCQIFGFP